MRKVIGGLSIVALLAPQPGALARDTMMGNVPPPPEQSLCRKPAALPDLGPETTRPQSQQDAPPALRSAVRGDVMAAPPPPPVVAPAAPEGETVIVTGSKIARPALETPAPVTTIDTASAEESDAAAPPPPAASIAPPPGYPRRPPQPQPQSGLLTAGEHDDLLNPELYAAYVARAGLGQRLPGLPLVDTGRVLRIEARDARGQAVPFAPIEVRCADGNAIVLKAVADGSAVFFPGLDRLGDTVWIRAAGGDWQTVDLTGSAGAQTIAVRTPGQGMAVRKLDLALAIDVTGSMGDELSYLQSELRSIIAAIAERHRDLDIRVAFTFYRDQGDEFVTRSFAFDRDIERAQTRLAGQRADGGGDYEEAMQDALVRAARLDWRPDAVKTLLLVGDAPPHDRDIARTWNAAEHLRAARVHIVPVGASGVGDTAEYVMRAMAAATQSRYTFLTDDSGIGNPHAPPAIDCYLVTRLDGLLRRVVDSQISGRRVEPDENEVIRSVGQYDAGKCVLPAGYQPRPMPAGQTRID